MKTNKLIIRIKRPVTDVFLFTITPPNSTLWVKSIVKEETNEWPIRVDTIYKLQKKDGQISEVTVANIKENKLVEWVSLDKNYHCRYAFKSVGKNVTELEYYEWIDKGILEDPFTMGILKKLKLVLER